MKLLILLILCAALGAGSALLTARYLAENVRIVVRLPEAPQESL